MRFIFIIAAIALSPGFAFGQNAQKDPARALSQLLSSPVSTEVGLSLAAQTAGLSVASHGGVITEVFGNLSGPPPALLKFTAVRKSWWILFVR